VERPDLTDDLIHIIRGYGLSDAYQKLLDIIRTRTILGSNRCIRGGYTCVCFSEAPIDCFKVHFREPGINQNHFQPFGITVPKRWLFDLGGRPVIYSPDSEYDGLPESYRWRHVRFEPTSTPKVDFTWEREWRIKSNELRISENNAKIFLPTVEYARHLFHWYERDQDSMVQMYSTVMYEFTAMLYRQDFKWQIEIIGF